MPKKAIRILVEYEDGSSSFAEGQAAAGIWRWLMAAEGLYVVHGAVYHGKKFEEREPAMKGNSDGAV